MILAHISSPPNFNYNLTKFENYKDINRRLKALLIKTNKQKINKTEYNNTHMSIA